MLPVLLLVLTAAPPNPAVEGLDKPKKVTVTKLGKSELTPAGEVTVRCLDVGTAMLVEVSDPGLIGAKDAWIQPKTDAAAPCDGNAPENAMHLEGVNGFGSIEGVRAGFIFVRSADGFGDREGLRVFQLETGIQVLDTERSMQKPATLRVDGQNVWLRFHEAVAATCDPLGASAERCWTQVKVEAGIPDDVKVKPPPCDARFKAAKEKSGKALLAVPVEVDLNSPANKKYLPGEATCEVAP